MMAEESDVTVQVEKEEVYVATAEPVEAEAEPADAEGEDKELHDKVKNPMDAMDGYTLLIMLLITSIIVFVYTLIDAFTAGGAHPWGTGDRAWVIWAFVGSLFSIICVVVLLILKKVAEDASVKASPWIALVLGIIWLAIVPLTFFVSGYSTISNGWLGIWLSVLVALQLTARAFEDKAKALKTAIESQTGSEATKYALYLGIGSLIVMIAVAVNFGCGGARSYSGYAVACAVISLVVCILIMVFANVAKGISGTANIACSIFLIVWWAIGAFVFTFVNPFKTTLCGLNGYIAVWVCVYFSFLLFKACGLDTVKGLISKMKGGNANNNNSDGNAQSDETPNL